MVRATVSLALGPSVLAALLGWIVPAQAMTVTQLDLTGGAANYTGSFDRQLDQLLGQEGTIFVGHYQPLPNIVPPITEGPQTFSLFTSGVAGAAAPSVVIDGSSITVNLSSLFFGVISGDALQAWRIGGLATGLLNPETMEFMLSWQHLLEGSPENSPAIFFLQGKVVGGAVQPVPIPAGLGLYATGLFWIGSWFRFRRHGAGSLKTSEGAGRGRQQRIVGDVEQRQVEVVRTCSKSCALS